MKEYVTLKVEKKIGTIEFFHPQSNSLPTYILNKLADTIKHAGESHNINVIILKSGGNRVFCAGASFDELMAINTSKEGENFFSGFANVINAYFQRMSKIYNWKSSGQGSRWRSWYGISY